MGLLKDMDSTHGVMDLFIKVISSKDQEMGMEFGKVGTTLTNNTKDIT